MIKYLFIIASMATLSPMAANSDDFGDFLSFCAAKPKTINAANALMTDWGWTQVPKDQLEYVLTLELEMKSLRNVFDIGHEREVLLKKPDIIRDAAEFFAQSDNTLRIIATHILEGRTSHKQFIEYYSSSLGTSYIKYGTVIGCDLLLVKGFDEKSLFSMLQGNTDKIGTDKWVRKYFGYAQIDDKKPIEIMAAVLSPAGKEIASELGYDVIGKIAIDPLLSKAPLTRKRLIYNRGD